MRLLFLICFLIFLKGGAEIEDHLKKALNKSPAHSIKNIDFLYIINLDQRPEKFASCLAQFSLYGIEPYRFSAVNGWELSAETINDLGLLFQPWMATEKWGTYYLFDLEPHHEPMHVIGRNYFCHCMSRGAIGIVLSHLSILKDALDSKYETIWVMEDDIDIVQNPHLLSKLIEELDDLIGKDHWDILFTDPDTKNDLGQYVPSFGFAERPNYRPLNPKKYQMRIDLNDNFRKVGSRFGAYSMILRRSGIEKIFKFIKEHQIFFPYDIDYVLPPEIELITLNYDLVSTQPKAISDNGAPNYLK